MSDINKLMVTVTRAIPYYKMTIREKVEMAQQTEREDLLEAVATDKSIKVRRALIDRAREIPDRILGEYLLCDADEYIREEAHKRIIAEKLTSNYYGKDGINFVLYFICKFFGTEFALTLESYENKRKALSALYLYYMKYGCYSRISNSKLKIFYRPFNSDAPCFRKPDSLIHILKGELKSDEPWEIELWGVLEKLSNYKYVPEQIEVVLAKKLIPDEVISNINELLVWLEQTNPNFENTDWINVLAKTLYNLGSPLLEGNDRVVAKCRLILNGLDTELTNEAEEALKEMYSASDEYTYYTQKI